MGIIQTEEQREQRLKKLNSTLGTRGRVSASLLDHWEHIWYSPPEKRMWQKSPSKIMAEHFTNLIKNIDLQI